MIKLIDEGRGTDKAIPQMILAGASVDDVFVIVLFVFFNKVHMRDSVKVLIILGISFALTFVEDTWSSIVPFASLIAVMALGTVIRKRKSELAARLSRIVMSLPPGGCW